VNHVGLVFVLAANINLAAEEQLLYSEEKYMLKLLLPERVQTICGDIAEMAGLRWENQTIETRREYAQPAPVERIDPFSESLGFWDKNTNTVVVFQNRCLRCAGLLHASAVTTMRVVGIHYVAHAVLDYGVHPNTGQTLAAAFQSSLAFADEPHSQNPAHHHFDGLIRDRELFAQVFSYLYLKAYADREQLRIFLELSDGHSGLYDLSPERYVHHLLRRDWKAEIDADWEKTAKLAALTFALMAGAVSASKRLITEDDA
jgi:hypothetical protein